MKALLKKAGKVVLVVAGTAAIVAGGLWAAKELTDEASVADDIPEGDVTAEGADPVSE